MYPPPHMTCILLLIWHVSSSSRISKYLVHIIHLKDGKFSEAHAQENLPYKVTIETTFKNVPYSHHPRQTRLLRQKRPIIEAKETYWMYLILIIHDKRALTQRATQTSCQNHLYEEEDTCQSYEEEDTCQSYEEALSQRAAHTPCQNHLYVRMYVYIRMYVCMYVCMYVQTHTHTHTHTHSPTHPRTHRHTDTQTHRQTDTQTHRHTDTQTHTHTNTHTHLALGLELFLPLELPLPQFLKSQRFRVFFR